MRLLELTEIDTLLNNCQLKQFAIDLLHPKYGAKIGRYPQTTVTIADPGRGWHRAVTVAAGAVGPPPQASSPRCSAEFHPHPKSRSEVPPALTGGFGSPSRGTSGNSQGVGRRWIVSLGKGNRMDS